MTGQNDPRLIVAHWADEATRAEANEETAQARAHLAEDRQAAEARVASPIPHGLAVFKRLRAWLSPPRR